MDGFKHNKLVLTALAVVMLFGSSFSQKQLNRDRAQLGLVRTDNPLENAPPMLAFTTVALGGFRGLIANALWIRATDLQQDGKYFEMVQLADWITKLQPHFTTVWIHQAWNMAYNISVKFPDKEDRWRWVRRGIELLRDEAIPLNPHEPLLYRELAWFFQHKMGQNMDDGHLYYKFSWAYDFQKVIGEPPYSFDRFIDPKTDADRENGRQLKDTYKMEARLMKSLDEQYGPLDWRLPEAHAIYWATKGLEKAKGNDLLSLRRVVYQSMQTAFTRGRLVVNKIDGNAELSPNPDIVQRVNDTYEEMIRANPMENIGHAHQNFLRYAVTTLYLYNREAEARKWWNVFRAKYPEEASRDPVMENYIVQRVTEIVRDEGKDKILATIEGYLSRSYYLLAIGEDDQALGYERFASQCWVLHQKKIDIERKPDIKARLDLGPYKGIKQRVLDRILDSSSGQFSPQLAAQLRTRLGLAADTQPTTTTANLGAPKFIKRPETAATNANIAVIPAPKQVSAKQTDGLTFLVENKKKPGVLMTGSGLQYKILKEGKGSRPNSDSTVTVHYRGMLPDGKEFDSSYSRGEPTTFPLTNVIRAWQEALPMMNVGSKWQLVVPPNLGYGDRGAGGMIGANQVLVFEIELLSFK